MYCTCPSANAFNRCFCRRGEVKFCTPLSWPKGGAQNASPFWKSFNSPLIVWLCSVQFNFVPFFNLAFSGLWREWELWKETHVRFCVELPNFTNMSKTSCPKHKEMFKTVEKRSPSLCLFTQDCQNLKAKMGLVSKEIVFIKTFKRYTIAVTGWEFIFCSDLTHTPIHQLFSLSSRGATEVLRAQAGEGPRIIGFSGIASSTKSVLVCWVASDSKLFFLVYLFKNDLEEVSLWNRK